MILYAESSAVLAWLFGEASGEDVRQLLAEGDHVLTSDLTLIECDRALHRAEREGHLEAADAAARRGRLARAAAGWTVLRIGPDVVRRARQPFPAEPIRSLDAVHLASALFAREKEPLVRLLTLDRRVRASADGLGLPILPD